MYMSAYARQYIQYNIIFVHVVYFMILHFTREYLYFGKPKNPLKVHLWGGISRNGPTDLLIFNGILESKFYVEHILKNTYKASVDRLYSDPEIDGRPAMWADNDPKHTSKLAQNYLEVTIYIFIISIFHRYNITIHILSTQSRTCTCTLYKYM